MSTERIDKLLSHEGFGTRREIKRLVRYSEVCVNGTRIFDSGFPVNPEKDTLTVDGEKRLSYDEQKAGRCERK